MSVKPALRRFIVKIAALALIPASLLAALPAACAEPAAEPDNPSYVSACPAWGAGYFYVPGSQTCLRLSGYVRADIRGGDNLYARTKQNLRRKTYAWRSRAALRMHTATQTDHGALRSFVELRIQWNQGAEYGKQPDSQHKLRFAYLELGGLRAGMDDSIFAHWTGYFGNVIMEDIFSPMEEARTNAVSYSFTAAELSNGSKISAILGFEQGDSAGDTGGFRYAAGGMKRYVKLSQQIGDYRPNIVGGLKWSHRLATLSAVAAFDSYYSEWAAKIRLNIQATEKLLLWGMAGYKSMDDYYNLDSSDITRHGKNGGLRQGIYRQINSLYGDWGGHWIFWSGGTYNINPQTDFNMQLSYSSDKSFAASANIQRSLVPGLTFVPELSYMTQNSGYGYKYSNSYEEKINFKGQNTVQGMMRLQRSF